MYNNQQQYYNTNPYYAQTPVVQYQQQKQANMTQPLTEEQMALISKTGGNFSTQVSQEDLLRSWCTHKRGGNLTLNSNGDGTVTCSICGETFNTASIDQDNVKEVTNNMIDILQTIKTCYLDAPDAMITEYFPIIELLKKVPKLAEIAMRNFSKYEQVNLLRNAGNPHAVQTYNAITGGFGSNPYLLSQQQPAVFDPYLQPMQGQPIYQNMQGQPMYTPQQPIYAPAAPQQVPVTPGYAPGFMPVNEFGAYGGGNAGQQPMQQPIYAPTQQPVQQQMFTPTQQPVQNAAPQQQVAPTPAVQPQQGNTTTADVSSFTL